MSEGDKFNDDPLDQAKKLAPLLLSLAADLRRLVNRRVETIEVIDEQTTRLRASVDITVPRGADLEATGEPGLRVLPVALLDRRALENFDITDESKTALPVLTSSESGMIAEEGLRAYAARILAGQPSQTVRDDLRNLASGTAEEALKAYSLMRDAAATTPESPDIGPDSVDAQRARLFRNRAMRRLMRLLTRTFILFVQTDVMLGERRVFKFTFEQPIDPTERDPIRWLWVRLGLGRSKLTFEAAAAAQARSYHAEIAAPEHLEIVEAELEAPGAEPARAGGGVARVHLNVTRARGAGRLRVFLRTQRGGFLRAALITSLLSCALLFIGRTRLDNLATEVEAASTMLFIVPGLLAAYLVRPGEHALVSSLLVGVRAMVLLTGLCSIAAGLVLVVELSVEDRELWWAFLAYLSALAAIFVAAANVLPLKGSRGTAEEP